MTLLPSLRASRRALRCSMFVCTSAMAAGSASADMLTSGGYIQNFDSMGVAGTSPPADWVALVGPSGTSNSTWTTSTGITGAGVAAMVATPNPLTATTTPSGNNNNGYNAAASPSATADRVLASAPTTVSGAAWQVTLTNATGAAVTDLGVSYDIVRYTTVSSANELPGYWLFYSLNGGTSWTNVAGLNPTIANVPNSIGTTPVNGFFSLAASLAPGANILLRWVDDNATQTSPDQIVGLNNVAISVVPLPAALPLLVSALGALGLCGRRWRLATAAG